MNKIKFLVSAILLLIIILVGIEKVDSVNDSSLLLDIRGKDIYIDSNITWKDNVTPLKENLIISPTGNLTLDNATLIFECTERIRYRIELCAGGQLYIYNNSNITSSPEYGNYGYLFLVREGSKLVIENSIISYCGYKGSDDELGLYLWTNDCYIRNCTFVNNWYAVYCKKGEPKIENNVITNNELGIVINPARTFAAPFIANNTISSNKLGGIYCERDYSLIVNNTFTGNGGPVITCVISSAHIIEGNRIDVNRELTGIQCAEECNTTILSNTITNASLYGVSVFSSKCELRENNIMNVSTGVYCEASNTTATNNTIKNSTDYGIWYKRSAGLIFNNNISSSPCGIYMQYSSAAIENNTFENVTEAQVLQKWELKVQVKVWDGVDLQPVEGANVTVKDNSSLFETEVLNLTTDESGCVTGSITEYKMVNYAKITYTPHLIEVYKYDAGEASELVEITKNIELELKIADLLPENLNITGVRSEGEKLTIKVNITNRGNLAATNVLVRFLCGDTVLNESYVIVSSEFSTPVTAPWTAVNGSHELKVEVDYGNEVKESNETNNIVPERVYINYKPLALLEITPTVAVYTYVDVTFYAYRSNDTDGIITAYRFDFGDGNITEWITSTTAETPWLATHNYTRKGIYNAKLKVKDNFSAESNWSSIVQVTVQNRPPVANISASKDETYTYEEIIFYAAGSSDGEKPYELLYGEAGHRIMKYYWDFGDGNFAVTTESIISHSYIDNGEYIIELIVQDNDFDNSTEKAFSVRILNRAPKASFIIMPGVASVNDKLQFNATSAEDPDGTIINWIWDFGDGSKGFGNLSEHSYTKAGIYRVVLTVFDDDGSNSTYEMYVEIKPLPTWIELHYKEVYLVGAIICIVGAVFFSIRWYVEARQREREVKAWAEKKGAEKEMKIEAEVEEWAEKKKKLKTIDERVREWAKRREAAKKAKEEKIEEWAKKREKEKVEKELTEWAAKKEAKKKK